MTSSSFRVIKSDHQPDEQVYLCERSYLSGRTLVPQTGPLTWVRTLDGYRLAGCELPATADEVSGGRRG